VAKLPQVTGSDLLRALQKDGQIVVTDTYNLLRFSDLRRPRRLADRRALVRWVRVGGSRAGLGRIGAEIGRPH